LIERYLAELKAELTYSEIVSGIEVLDEFVTDVSGFIDCEATLVDGSVLFLTEYLKYRDGGIERDKYSYHWQKNGDPIFRYDNAPITGRSRAIPITSTWARGGRGSSNRPP